MSWKILFLFCAITFLIPVALAQPVEIMVINPTNNISFENALIDYRVLDGDSNVLSFGTAKTSDNSSFILDLPNQQVIIELSYYTNNDIGTLSGKNTINILESTSKITVPMDTSKKIHIVVESSDKYPLPDAIVKLDCDLGYFNQEVFYTDSFGEVTLSFTHSDSCFLRVGYEEYIYREELNISQGETLIKNVTFDKVKIKKPRSSYYLILIVIFIASLFIFRKKLRNTFYSRKNSKMQPLEDTEKTSVTSNDEFIQDEIIGVLNNKEQDVVKFLLSEYDLIKNNKSKSEFFLNQARIIRGANIPKTSLIRVFTSLEQKGLITIKKLGKSKRVYLGPKLLK